MPVQDEYAWNQLGRSLGDLGQGLQWLFPGATTMLTGKTPKTNWASTYSSTTQNSRQIPSSLPTGARITSPNTGTRTASQNIGTRITSPNTIVQRGSASDGVPDEYRAQLSAWENKRRAAAGALKGFQPGSGPMPDAATEASQAGQELWKKLHPGLAKPGGAVGTYNPLMQARGDVPSIADLWKGMPTSGPGKTEADVTDEAMAKARAEGRYFEPSGTMGGFAPAADPATQQRMQQFGTAMQAQKGTEETSASQRTSDFLNKFKLGSLNLGSDNFLSYDANAMMNAPSVLFK